MRRVNDLRRCVNCKGAGPSTHGYEEDAAEQSPSERRFDDLFITPGASAVSPQQRRDVEGHLGDRAEGGVHHCSHCKITLRRQATHTQEEKSAAPTCSLGLSSPGYIQNKHYLAIPMPMK